MKRVIKISGKCDHCHSEKGHWDTENLWHCEDCDRVTSYFEITELGIQVLKELGVQSSLLNTSEESK